MILCVLGIPAGITDIVGLGWFEVYRGFFLRARVVLYSHPVAAHSHPCPLFQGCFVTIGEVWKVLSQGVGIS